MYDVKTKICYNCHLHATREGPVSEVSPPWAPDTVVREGHPTIITFTHKQRVLHLLTRAIVIWKRSSAAHTDGRSSSSGSISNTRCSSSTTVVQYCKTVLLIHLMY